MWRPTGCYGDRARFLSVFGRTVSFSASVLFISLFVRMSTVGDDACREGQNDLPSRTYRTFSSSQNFREQNSQKCKDHHFIINRSFIKQIFKFKCIEY